MNINTLESPQEVAVSFASDLQHWIESSPAPSFSIALSGGSTPKILFKHWASGDCQMFKNVNFFWGDERCVPPDHEESNYGVTNDLFFRPASISPNNVHRIHGEADPVAESIRYSKVLQQNVELENGSPQFDVVILGMGTDGHTASIFPNQMELMESESICAVATHPETGQRRVTLTGNTIGNAKKIVFLVTGSSKKEKFAAIRNRSPESELWPATRFMHMDNTFINIDEAVVR